MCNAHNHPPGCTCGWGGEGHAGRSYGTSYGWQDSWEPRYASFNRHTGSFDTFATFVNPSARCPVCREPVFFYQSPDGGRVFFDALGPPWPKHPCTDKVPSSHISWYRPLSFEEWPSAGAATPASAARAEDCPWFQAGWVPLIAEQREVTDTWSQLEGVSLLSATPVRYFAPTADLGLAGAPKFIARRGEDYWLSTVQLFVQGHVVPVQTRLYLELPWQTAWAFDPELAELMDRFMGRESWPHEPFVIPVLDASGTQRWVSQPIHLYKELRAMIATDPERLSADLRQYLRHCLRAILTRFAR